MRLLDLDIWSKRDAWPRPDKTRIFLAEALDLTGKAMHRDAWTGDEIQAVTRLSLIPSDIERAIYRWPKRGSRPEQTKCDAERIRREQNNAGLDRLFSVANWIGDRCRDDEVATYIRPISGGEFLDADASLWNVDDVLTTHFRRCRCDYQFGYGPSSPCHIFLDRSALSAALAMVAPIAIPETEGLHLSPYMRLLLAVIREEDIRPSNQPKIETIKGTIKFLGPKFGIDEVDLGDTLTGYLATAVRELGARAGRAKKG